MSQEFYHKSPGVVQSDIGFSVTTTLGGSVVYEDPTGVFRIDAEWMGNKNGIILYRSSPSNKGSTAISEAEIVSRVVRGLKYQGYLVELV